MKYIIDSCSLINAYNNYNMHKIVFAPVWNKLTEMVNNKTLISTEEVRDELKDDDLVSWVKNNKVMFLPTDKNVQDKVREILNIFPSLIKLKSTENSNADPFLIAVAILTEDSVVVTDERMGDEKSGNIRIPNVCKKYGIKCISLRDFIESILE